MAFLTYVRSARCPRVWICDGYVHCGAHMMRIRQFLSCASGSSELTTLRKFAFIGTWLCLQKAIALIPRKPFREGVFKLPELVPIPNNRMIRPSISISNTSSTATVKLGYKAVLDVDGLQVGNATPYLEDWYSPDCDGTLLQVTPKHIKVTWTFSSHALEPGQSVSLGDWGIHFGSDWVTFDKSALTSTITLFDASGNVLDGPHATTGN